MTMAKRPKADRRERAWFNGGAGWIGSDYIFLRMSPNESGLNAWNAWNAFGEILGTQQIVCTHRAEGTKAGLLKLDHGCRVNGLTIAQFSPDQRGQNRAFMLWFAC